MSNTSPKVVYYPEFDDTEVLQQQVARACWYIAPIDPQTILFSINEVPDTYIPDGYTPELSSTFASGVPVWLQFTKRPLTANDLLNADVVVCWKGFECLSHLHPNLEARLRKNGTFLFDVDHTHRVEGSRYIDISHRYFANDAEIIEQSHQKMVDLRGELSDKEKAFLFCSGPEVQRYPGYDFSTGINIVCNSVINDLDLMGAVKPDIQIFGDPIFHFGCSMYASEFRKRLAEMQDQYGFINMIPVKYFNLFTYWQPELAEHTIAIPFDLNIDINLDLLANFQVHTTDNILTLMMLPVACSFARQIYLLGCDGRPLSDNTYFWKHNEKAQFGSQMGNIQDVHPTFFTVDYDDYYLRHCNNVEAYFNVGEASGKQFISLTPSHIPAIHNREHLFARTDGQEIVIAIEPAYDASRTSKLLDFYAADAKELKIYGPLLSQNPGTKPYFSADGFDEEFDWLADQIALSKKNITLAQGIASLSSVEKLAQYPQLQHFTRRVVLCEEVTSAETGEQLLQWDQFPGFQLFAGSDRVANALAWILPDLEVIPHAGETHVGRPPKPEPEAAPSETPPDIEEMLLDVRYELEKNNHLIRQQSSRTDAQGDLIVRLDDALRLNDTRLAESRSLVREVMRDKEALESHMDRLLDENERLKQELKDATTTASQIHAQHNELIARIQALESSHKHKEVLGGDSTIAQQTLTQINSDLETLEKQIQSASHIAQSGALDTEQKFNQISASLRGELNSSECAQLADFTQASFGVSIDPEHINLLAHRINTSMSSCIGANRLSLGTMTTLALTLLHAGHEKLSYLEVGGQHGICMAVIWDSLRHAFKRVQMIGVDPFAESITNDSMLALLNPSSESVLDHNLKRVNADRRKVKVINKPALGNEVLTQLNKRKFNFLNMALPLDKLRAGLSIYSHFIPSGGVVLLEASSSTAQLSLQDNGLASLARHADLLVLRKV